MNMKRKISGKKLYFNVESLLINFKLNYNFTSFLIFLLVILVTYFRKFSKLVQSSTSHSFFW